MYEIAVSVFNISPFPKTVLVVPPAAVPDDSYFTNKVRSSVPSPATALTTFAITPVVAPVSFVPIKSVLKFSVVCTVEPTVNVA